MGNRGTRLHEKAALVSSGLLIRRLAILRGARRFGTGGRISNQHNLIRSRWVPPQRKRPPGMTRAAPDKEHKANPGRAACEQSRGRAVLVQFPGLGDKSNGTGSVPVSATLAIRLGIPPPAP